MSTATAPTKHEITPEDLLAIPDGKCFELVDGELVERNMDWTASRVGGRLYGYLFNFCEAHDVGWLAPADASYQCFADDPQRVRRPEVSIWLERLSGDKEPKRHCPIAPDLAVEVISPGDLYSRVEAKVDEYLQAGTRLVWVVNPPTRTVRIHRNDGTVIDVGPDGELDGEDVLPVFRCRIADLFRTPGQE